MNSTQIKEKQRALVRAVFDLKATEQDLKEFYAGSEWQAYLSQVRGQSIDNSAMSASYGA